jgi:hypothetical protein
VAGIHGFEENRDSSQRPASIVSLEGGVAHQVIEQDRFCLQRPTGKYVALAPRAAGYSWIFPDFCPLTIVFTIWVPYPGSVVPFNGH